MAETDACADYTEKAPRDASEVYGEDYYKNGLGPLAYERSPHWLEFFARVADDSICVFRPESVLDAGCAMGMLVESFWDRGVKAEGIDVSSYAISKVRPDMRRYCRVASLTDPIEGKFDLVTCIEVLEHMERPDAEIAIANICRATEAVLFSSTSSDFNEPTHVNVSPPLAWIELFAAQGFGTDLTTDAAFLAPQAMIFRKSSSCDTMFLKAYALTARYRILSAERLEVIAGERGNTRVAWEAQIAAETQLALEVQRRAEAEFALEIERARSLTALQAERTQAETALEAERRQAETVLEAAHSQARSALEVQGKLEAQVAEERQARQRADAQASLQAKLRAESLANLTAQTQRYQTQIKQLETRLHELGNVIRDMQASNSWRLTLPIRLGGLFLRSKLRRPMTTRSPDAESHTKGVIKDRSAGRNTLVP